MNFIKFDDMYINIDHVTTYRTEYIAEYEHDPTVFPGNTGTDPERWEIHIAILGESRDVSESYKTEKEFLKVDSKFRELADIPCGQ